MQVVYSYGKPKGAARLCDPAHTIKMNDLIIIVPLSSYDVSLISGCINHPVGCAAEVGLQ